MASITEYSFPRNFLLECKARFISEEWTESYMKYDEGSPQDKIMHGAKKLAELAALQLGRPVGKEFLECAE